MGAIIGVLAASGSYRRKVVFMADIIWGTDFRAKARRKHEETIEQKLIREIMGSMGVVETAKYPDEPFPWANQDEPA